MQHSYENVCNVWHASARELVKLRFDFTLYCCAQYKFSVLYFILA